ncbi:hypothetical protein Tco_0537745 [Tanacetum coccineum]
MSGNTVQVMWSKSGGGVGFVTRYIRKGNEARSFYNICLSEGFDAGGWSLYLLWGRGVWLEFGLYGSSGKWSRLKGVIKRIFLGSKVWVVVVGKAELFTGYGNVMDNVLMGRKMQRGLSLDESLDGNEVCIWMSIVVDSVSPRMLTNEMIRVAFLSVLLRGGLFVVVWWESDLVGTLLKKAEIRVMIRSCIMMGVLRDCMEKEFEDCCCDLQIWSYYDNVKEAILLHNALSRQTKDALVDRFLVDASGVRFRVFRSYFMLGA